MIFLSINSLFVKFEIQIALYLNIYSLKFNFATYLMLPISTILNLINLRLS